MAGTSTDCAAAEALGDRLAARSARVAAELRTTRHGAEWLLRRLARGLAAALQARGSWDDAQRRLALDLLGIPPELRADHPLGRPAADLIGRVRREVRALRRLIRGELALLDEANRRMAAQGFAYDIGPIARRLRGYESASERLFHRTLDRLDRRARTSANEPERRAPMKRNEPERPAPAARNDPERPPAAPCPSPPKVSDPEPLPAIPAGPPRSIPPRRPWCPTRPPSGPGNPNSQVPAIAGPAEPPPHEPARPDDGAGATDRSRIARGPILLTDPAPSGDSTEILDPVPGPNRYDNPPRTSPRAAVGVRTR